MPSKPASGPSGRPAVGVDLPLRRPEWDLLVRLPRAVLVAACAGDERVDAVAGVEAIAAGQRSRALLVRGVVAAIFAEQLTDNDIDDTAAEPAAVLADCGYAVRLLAERIGPDVALAYGEWLMDIAASVGRTAWQAARIRLAGVEIQLAERRFVNGIALELTRGLRR
ncbi:hypothetical protein [Dactylosporangium sp. NPDC049140]|jgi:hypothetical protein|uniref:hypothetical protein n=1 Tax=Dactylosporangium sp. NPDC049140 TaxID=3155647 RepID=UPI0033CF37FD